MLAVPYRFIFIVLLVLTSLANRSNADDCLHGNNIQTTESRTLPSFQAIDIQGAFDVTVQRQNNRKLSVTADQNLLPYIQTKVQQDTLFISASRSICTRRSLSLDIAEKNIRKIKSSGANDIAYTNIQTDTLTIDFNDSGEINLSGRVSVLMATMSGATEMEAENLKADDVHIKVMDAGDATVHANQKLDAVITDAGSITYHGNPRIVTKKISDAGDLTKE